MDAHEPVRSPVGCVFGPFTLDFVRRRAWRSGEPIALSGKSFEILAYLIANRDRVVTKDDLLREIWPDTFVQENNLVRHVSTLRKTLGQRPDQHDYVLTVQGRGYRFVSEVEDLAAIPAHLLTPSASLAVTNGEPPAAFSPVVASHRGADVPTETGEGLASGVVLGGRTLARRFPTRLAAGVGAIVVFTVGWAFWGASARPSASRVLRPVTYGPGIHAGPAWSPDGQFLALAAERDGNIDVVVQSLSQPDAEPRRLTSAPEADWQPAWSPDGRFVAFRSERDGGGVFVVAAAGGPARRVSTFGYEPRWSPDSTRLLIVSSPNRRPRPLPFVVGLDGQPPKPALAEARRLWDPSFAWLPDGRLSATGSDASGWQLMVGPVEGEAVRVPLLPSLAQQVKDLSLILGRIAWSSDGRFLYLEGRSHDVSNLWRIEVDPDTLAWRGGFERLTTGQGIDRSLAVSPDGTRLAFESGTERTRIWAFSLDKITGAVMGDGQPVTPGSSGEFDAALSRDGRQLVYRTNRDGRQELWQHSMVDGRERRLLTDPAAERSSPRWSPDGSSLIYLVSRRDTAERAAPKLAVLSPAGGGERFIDSLETAGFIPDDWSADGQAVLGACPQPQSRRSEVCLVTLTGVPAIRPVVSDPERSLRNTRFSPDQGWISFTAARMGTGTSTLYVRRAGGGPFVPLTDGQHHVDKAHWSPDGRTLYFVSNRSGLLNVWARRFDPAAGQPVGDVFQVTRFDGLWKGFASDLEYVDLAVTVDRIFLPVTEHPRQVWVLDNVNR